MSGPAKVARYPLDGVRLLRIIETIEAHGWPARVSRHSVPIREIVVSLLERLTPDQQEVLEILMRSYRWFRFSDYIPLLEETLENLTEADVKDMRNLAIFPVMTRSALNGDKVKSGQAFIYPAKVQIARTHPLLKKLNYIDKDNVRALASGGLPRHTLTIFVDDFIGTGDTVDAVLREYELDYNSGVSRVIVACLAAQSEGFNRIQDAGYKILAHTVLSKGVTDNPEFADKVRALSLIDEIESQLKIGASYRRGYKASEALVTMARTPNNTFPLFWQAEDKGGSSWPALFPRF